MGELSTFAVGSVYKIGQSDDGSKQQKKREDSPIVKKLDFGFKSDGKELSSDFWETMIAPTQDDMDQLLQDIAPKVNVFKEDNGKKLEFAPKTSHIIDLKEIRSSSNSPIAPKKLLIKKKTTTPSSEKNKA